MKTSIEPMNPSHWEDVSTIYAEGIQTGNATFQLVIPTWQEWDKDHLKKCRLVCLFEGKVIGWAALTPVSGRCVYAGVAEVSVYVAERFRGKKIGFQLLEQLIKESEDENFWTLQSGIFPENSGSIKIHEKLGFRIVGFREKIRKMNGKWRDTLLLERRSKRIEAD
ncbi:GNAT family N-acetyltransferase [Aquiflexum gelatinilyticum]|uniref:GNAT family N-acetyltransferase n=1 Tax=Aquiflexum gelatinilyticum TaxID=2961943 RepID=UPI002169460E|nr:GNAT family N-acetyltransferase [Aquiflexum gelatinilyticum]MCS4436176.1 GNAT family N-acetyltransferase [Aquiflexum gelatinilyticum]